MTPVGHAVVLLDEAVGRVRFAALGRESRHDPVGVVVSKVISAIPEFRKSVEDKQIRKNGMTISGAWPTTGRHIFDWEIDSWGERAGDVILKFNLWGESFRDGISYRANIATIDRLVPKISKWFYSVKTKVKKAGVTA